MSMRRSSSFGACALAAFAAFAALPAFAVAPNQQSAALEFPLEYFKATHVDRAVALADAAGPRSLPIGTNWQARVSPQTGLVRMAYGADLSVGRAITSDAVAEEAAREILDLASGVLGTRHDNIALRNVSTMTGKWAVHFKQVVNGVPVYMSSAFVLLHDGGQVAAFGSKFFPNDHHHDVARGASLSQGQAIDAAVRALSATRRLDRPTETELFYVPVIVDETYELRLAYRVVFQSDEPFGRWESFVDASTGEILARRNFFHTVNVTGTAQGDIEDFGYCDGVATDTFENMTVNVTGGNNDVTDDAGQYDITHGGATPVTVTAQMLGPFSNVNRYSGLGADASFSGAATPGTPFTINWTNTNSRADERDTFFHANRVHDFVKAIDPTFTFLDYAMPSIIGRTDGFCPGNAWWDGNGMNYCSGTGTYGNTGQIGNVIYHEFGHGVTQEVYANNGGGDPAGDLHEGNSDVLANLIDRQPIIGLGFFTGNCVSGIRNSDNTLQYPEDAGGEGHAAGQVIAGFVWDTWQSMLADLPQNDADDAIRSMWHFSRVLGVPNGGGGAGQQEQVDWSFLADDDDANLLNGTPHYDNLVVGATNHGFAYPLFGVLITHTPIASTADGSAGFDVRAIITSTASTIDPASLFVHYRVNGGSFNDVLMTATGNPNEYSGAIPPLVGDDLEVQYYISAADLASNTRTSPLDAPTDLYAFDVAYVYANLESGSAGWTIGAPGDNATTGIWTLVNPIGTAAQPEDDATPAPGVNAFITGQCSGGACGGGCDLGCNDVDGGTTTLLSPIYDLAGATSAKIKYQRWYSNNTGGAPDSDFWVVDVSNNGGTSWVNVENTLVSIAAWTTISVDIDALFGTPGQVRLRFRAADLNTGSLVEAGVDELVVLANFGAVGVEEIAAANPLTFDLAQNQPNPFGPATRVDFSIPAKANVSLAIYDVTGRAVRTLAEGAREAGRYSIPWDGRDATGARVSAGVYFYRLTSEGETLTRKMTILK